MIAKYDADGARGDERGCAAVDVVAAAASQVLDFASFLRSQYSLAVSSAELICREGDGEDEN